MKISSVSEIIELEVRLSIYFSVLLHFLLFILLNIC
jgi:hypothetical protein